VNFAGLEKKAQTGKPLVIAVCGADGDDVYEALKEAQDKKLARFLLVGNKENCAKLAKKYGIEPVEIVDSSSDEEASALVRFQQAYQANAKVMQTAMDLFQSILQVR